MSTALSQPASVPTPVSPQLWFGIGCFHFAWTRPGPYTFKAVEYEEALKKVLEQVPTLNNLAINVFRDAHVYEVDAGSLPTLEDGTGIGPHPQFLEIEFDLYIPTRIQEEILGAWPHKRTTNERFRVFVAYTYHMPAAFIQVLDAPPDASPSDSVRVIRDYLGREMARMDGAFRFEYLAPTPFHAEGELEGRAKLSESTGYPLTITLGRPPGFAKLQAFYDPAVYASPDDAFKALRRLLEPELGVFYEVHRVDMEWSLQWEGLQSTVHDVVHPENKRGRFSRAKDWAVGGRQIRRIFAALVAFETEHVFSRSAIDQAIRHIYEGDARRSLKPLVDDAIRDLEVYPTEQTSRLITYLTQERGKAMEYLVIIVASLLSAIVGGLIGAFIGSGGS